MARYRSGSYYGFMPYVSVAEKEQRARQALTRLRRKGHQPQPVQIAGRDIAKTWWGRSWCANLERYADFESRIGRGRSYVRDGAVLDLSVKAGKISALVQGSRPDPYEVAVRIAPLPEAIWAKLREASLKELHSLPDLLAGQFPEALRETFFAQGSGLFPAPAEIQFECSCPDWASMCKHVAAVLYGVGNRLDQAPELLFTLRQVTVADLIARTVDATAAALASRAGAAQGEDVLTGVDLGGMFGIDLDTPSAPPPSVQPEAPMALAPPPKRTQAKPAAKPASGKGSAAKGRAKPAAARKRQQAETAAEIAALQAKIAKLSGNAPLSPVAKAKPVPGKSKAAAKGKKVGGRKPAAPAEPPQPGRMIEQLLAVLTPAAFGLDDLVTRLPGWQRLQVGNTLQRACARGLVERVSPGRYRRA